MTVSSPGKSSDKNISPVGWYVASYLLRFIELDDTTNDDPEGRFLVWENTIILRARDLDEAYDRTLEIASESTESYKGGSQGVDVQWVFEGITEILPIYEELKDGTEITWTERNRKLKNIRKMVRKKGDFRQ